MGKVYAMYLKSKTYVFALIALGLFSIFGFNLYQPSYSTYCFDCPDANFHLDEAKKAIDSGNYSSAKNHIDQAKQLIGQYMPSNQTVN